ncbi:Ig-like domain-containing protein [Halobacillus locisalis]|uniref:Ig-like domain-containing protein n=1 Tax=Halobacillus locisalis TaxID=220753 RepID=A0A838CU21_9BACI|nr:CAP domain-containing protein [Halobacillus locisalis]MBA2175480.1 Ig-like domain-containing protein [Halobacillus locisalis]
MKRLIMALIILFILSYSPIAAEETDTVWSNKSWTVTFNTAMDFSNLNEAIYVWDKDRNKVPVQLQASSDNKFVEVVGMTPWTFKPGQTYTIYITPALSSIEGTPMKETFTKTFTVNEQADQELQVNDLIVTESNKSDVTADFGEPVEVAHLSDEYRWEVYHDQFEDFIMVLYNGANIVHGYYTNQDIFELSGKFRLNASFDSLEKTYKERAYMIKDDDGRPEKFIMGREDVTLYLFLDVFRNSKLTSTLIMSRKAEEMYYNRTNTLEEVSDMQIYQITNAIRVRYGLNPLKRDVKIDEVAYRHSVDMADNEYFAHVNLQGQGILDRLNDANLSYRSSGENIAAGYATGIEAMEGWMNSAGHRKNLLAEHDLIGVGVRVDKDSPYGIYYTQDFASE